jgi:hypothetical protein
VKVVVFGANQQSSILAFTSWGKSYQRVGGLGVYDLPRVKRSGTGADDEGCRSSKSGAHLEVSDLLFWMLY